MKSDMCDERVDIFLLYSVGFKEIKVSQRDKKQSNLNQEEKVFYEKKSIVIYYFERGYDTWVRVTCVCRRTDTLR